MGGEFGLRDLNALKTVISLPGNGSLTCLLGKRLLNRKDLYSQLGWFAYYMIEGEPFNSKNRTLAVLMLIWGLNRYQLEFDAENIAKFVIDLDTMKQGNSDISFWLSNNCR
jgi:hypothetical protein